MLTNMFAQDTHMLASVNKEGELYKAISVEGRTFKLYYGYYEECERSNRYAEPIPIYPDFRNKPVFTSTGYAFVTKMQDACKHYIGADSPFSECAECAYYKHGDDLIGICTCPSNKQFDTNNTINENREVI